MKRLISGLSLLIDLYWSVANWSGDIYRAMVFRCADAVKKARINRLKVRFRHRFGEKTSLNHILN